MKKRHVVLLLFFTLAFYMDGASIIISKSITNITITNNKMQKDISFELVVNDRSAEKYTNIKIECSNLQKVSKIKAWIEDLNGKEIKRLSDSEIKTHSSIRDFSLYEDNMVKEFTLKHNIYPYVLKYSYMETEEQFLYIEYWTPAISQEVPAYASELTIKAPVDYLIHYKSAGVSDFKIDTVNNQCTYHWKASYSPLPEPETFSLNPNQLLPYVKIVPEKFIFKYPGSFSSWQSYGDWQYNAIRNLQKLPSNEIKTIKELVSNKTDSIEMLRTLYHYLEDQTRYVNVTIETGGMIPYPADYVAKNKYGDCKALSNYFLSILKYMGFKAIYTNVYAGENNIPIDKSFPSQQSNHIILCVPLKNDTVWLDCTSDGPFNYLGTFSQGRDAFLIQEGKSHFTRTPALRPVDVCEKRLIKIKQADNQPASIEFSNTYKGEKFELLRSLINADNTSDQNIYIRNNLISEGGFDPENYKINKGNRDSTSIGLEYNATTSTIFMRYGNDLILKTIPIQIPHLEKPALRKYDLEINIPINRIDSQTYLLSDVYKFSVIPVNQDIRSEYGHYSLRWIQTGKSLLVIKNLVLLTGKYPLKKYGNLYDFISKIIHYEDNSAVEIIKN